MRPISEAVIECLLHHYEGSLVLINTACQGWNWRWKTYLLSSFIIMWAQYWSLFPTQKSSSNPVQQCPWLQAWVSTGMDVGCPGKLQGSLWRSLQNVTLKELLVGIVQYNTMGWWGEGVRGKGVRGKNRCCLQPPIFNECNTTDEATLPPYIYFFIVIFVVNTSINSYILLLKAWKKRLENDPIVS